MASPEQFSRRMGQVGANVTRNVDELMRRVAIGATQAVISATPVDTGRARSNWLASIDTIRSENIEALAPGAAATQVAIQEATAIIRSYNGDSHSEIRLQNSLPYIDPLNNGSSAQAPAGFVRLGVQAAVNAVQGARLLDDRGL